MLKKLIKHDWSSVWKVLTIMNSFTLIMTVLGCLTFCLPIWKNDFSFLAFVAMSAFMLYYMTIIVVSFTCIIYLGVHFYKNLYTDQGYLMHTLPVTPRQLLLSKLIVSASWVIITGAVIFFSIAMLAIFAIINVGASFDLTRSFYEVLTLICNEFFGVSFVVAMIWLLFACVVESFASVCIIFGAISLGQLFSKYKLMASLLCYFGITTVMQVLSSIVSIPISMEMMDMSMQNMNGSYSPSSFMNPLMFLSVILSFVFGISLYFISEYIMKRKLNLD